jgi:hypothetical protein
LHPGWGVGFGAGVDIEGEAYGEKDAVGEEGFEALEEFLLFWCAETDPEEIGATGYDMVKNGAFFIMREIALLEADNIKLRIGVQQALAEFFSAFWTAPEEVVREFGGAAGEEFSQKGGAIDAVLKRGALAVQAPDEGHAIGDEEVNTGRGGGECGVVPPHGDDVGIGKIDGVGARLLGAGQEVRAEGLVICAGEIGGEDAAGYWHAGKRFSRGGAENAELLEEEMGGYPLSHCAATA